MRAVAAMVVAFGLLVGCSSSSGNGGASDGGAATPCDPLAAKPLTLGAVVGVGRDEATGRIYVDASHGVFVVDDGDTKLIRQHVTGTGSSGTTELIFSFEAPGADASTAQQLLIETMGSTATAMALGPSSSKAFLNESPAGTTALTLVNASTVSGLAVVNTPQVISYLADVSNGDVILATLPMNADETSAHGGLAIFYGPPNAVAQRPITAFMETLSGNGSLTFLVDGKPYSLDFGEVAAPDAGPFGTFSLLGLTPAARDTLTVITLRSPTPSALPQALSFACLP